MSHEFNSLELARIYESQGYFQDAFDMYQALANEAGEKGDQHRESEINAGLGRMEFALQNQANPLKENSDPVSELAPSEKRMDHLLEQWLMLMVLEKRLKIVKQVKSLL